MVHRIIFNLYRSVGNIIRLIIIRLKNSTGIQPNRIGNKHYLWSDQVVLNYIPISIRTVFRERTLHGYNLIISLNYYI